MKILIVDDEKYIRESMQRLFELEGLQAETAMDGADAVELLKEKPFDAIVADLKMPRMGGQALLEWTRAEGIRIPVIMISALGEIQDAVRALKSGATDYLIKPFDPAELLHKVTMAVEAKRREGLVEAGASNVGGEPRFIGDSASAKEVRRLIKRVADTATTVLITGESGTGKEVVAREIHELSPRAAEPFVAINIGGIHEQLMESELFGHEKGAFTGADARRAGLFETAAGGTLFLDEIGEMPAPLQVKLLRVLQDRKIRRLGGTRDIPVEARIVSATNKDLAALVKEGKFREDLYYRLNVVRIDIPPLRERSEDIPALAGFLLARTAARMGKPIKRLTQDAMEALMIYPFQGNIRELENILERAFIYSTDQEIAVSDLAIIEKQGYVATPGRRRKSDALFATNRPDSDLEPLAEVERAAIERALTKWNGNRTRAAAELGISRRTILNKIKLYSSLK